MSVVIESFRPVCKGTLRGFARVRFESGLVMDEITVHIASDDGRAWCAPPGRPMIGPDGIALRDAKTGKVKYAGLITFTTSDVRHRWVDEILAALAAKYPEALQGARAA